jgi:hypothetical protein
LIDFKLPKKSLRSFVDRRLFDLKEFEKKKGRRQKYQTVLPLKIVALKKRRVKVDYHPRQI